MATLNFQEGWLVTEISTDVFGNRFVSWAERSLVVTGRDSRGPLPSTPTEYSDVDLTYFIEKYVDGRTWTEVPEINDNPVFVFEPQNIIIDWSDNGLSNILYTFYNNNNFLLNFNISFPEEESKFTIKRQDNPLWLRGVFPQELIVKNNNSNGFHQDCGDGFLIPTFEEKHQALIGLQGPIPSYITLSSSSKHLFFNGNCTEGDYRYIGAILMGLDILDGNPSVTTTTVAPCVELESIPDRVPNAPYITSSSSSASVPAGVDMSLHVDELSYNLLHGVSTNIENNQQFTTATTLGQLDSYSYFSISSTSTIQVEGTINITLRSYDLDKIIATKNISQPTKVINFTNSDIINKDLDLSNNNILIEFRSLCNISEAECCEPLDCLRLFNEINDFCIEDPCNNVLPISNFFTTDRFTRARFILHNNDFVFLDTGYVNTTLESVSDYIVTFDGSMYFRNKAGQLYLLDYKPSQIYSSDDVVDVSNPVSYHQPKIYSTTSTWAFKFDECDIKFCVREET